MVDWKLLNSTAQRAIKNYYTWLYVSSPVTNNKNHPHILYIIDSILYVKRMKGRGRTKTVGRM